MANVKISELTAATSLAGTDQFEINAGGTSKSAEASKIADYIASATITLTNKTFDTAGTGNSFKINGTTVSAVTGTGSAVLATSPTLTTPNLGTPSAITLTNGTGLPVSTGVSGLGTGVATALAVNTGGAGAVVLYDGALGTPSSGTLTNATGLPISTGISGLGTGVATALAVNVGSAGAAVVNGGALGTPSSGTLTNATGLPVGTGVSGLGTGVATALAVNVGSAGAPVVNGGALGTPSSGTLTNATGLPVSTGVSGLGTGVATALAINTGSSGAVVLNGGALGTPSSGTLTNATGLPLTTGVTGTLPVANGGTGATTLTGILKGAGTSAITAVTAPTGDIVGTTDTQTLTNKTLTAPTMTKAVLNDGFTEEVYAISDGASVSLDPNNGSIQTWTLGANRTPDQANWAAGQSITLLVDDGTARTITWTTLAVTWKTNAGVAPTLNTSGYTVIVLWKVGTTIYGARVGDA